MRAAVYHGPEDIRVEDVPKPAVESSEGALVRVTHTAVCGSDLWFYHGERDREVGSQVGHEPMGIVEEVGEDVTSIEPGDRVFAPFRISCGQCEFCRRGLHTSCENGGSWIGDVGGAQGEYVKTPYADGTLVRVPDRYADDEETLESLLPLTDVMATGHHAAVSAEVGPADSCVVVGDGAVGLCGVLAACRLGAREIVVTGHHADRLELAEEFGATETVLGSEDTDTTGQLQDVTNGGVDHVLECVGTTSSMNLAINICRPAGTIGYVGAPYSMVDDGFDIYSMFGDNITLQGGVTPARAYAEELIADVLSGNLDPAPVFTKTVDLEDVPEGYEAMSNREAIKVIVKP